MEPLQRTAEELEFQPALLALLDSPAPAAPRRFMQLIVLFFLIALVWAVVGRLEIIAVAPGKVVPDGRTKVVRIIEPALVRRIAVRDGDVVAEGQVLLELDAVGVHSDKARSTGSLTSARLNLARERETLRALENGGEPRIAGVLGATSLQLAEANGLALRALDALTGKRNELAATLAQRRAELVTTQNAIPALRAYAQIAADRVRDYERLLQKNYVSRQEYLVREQERISAERDLRAQEDRRTELAAGISAAEHDLTASNADARRTLLDAAREAEELVVQLEADVARSDERRETMVVRSPVAGTVQQLTVHSPGSAVAPTDQLMSIVPVGDGLEVEATVMNRDIGFVTEGQEVVGKLDTFPFSHFGFIKGHVVSLSGDAVQDEKLGLVFPVRVRLERQSIKISGRDTPLRAGMTLSVEIRTGDRTIADYFIESLAGPLEESARER
jgi:hemolysin D